MKKPVSSCKIKVSTNNSTISIDFLYNGRSEDWKNKQMVFVQNQLEPSTGILHHYHLIRGSTLTSQDYNPSSVVYVSEPIRDHLAVFSIDRNAICCYDFIWMLLQKWFLPAKAGLCMKTSSNTATFLTLWKAHFFGAKFCCHARDFFSLCLTIVI